MPRTRQMFEAAAILSSFLSASGIPHAFYGGFTSVALGSPRDTEVMLSPRVCPIQPVSQTSLFTQEMCCVVEGGFKGVRLALTDCDIMTVNQSSWSGRLFVTYQDPIPPIEVSAHPQINL